MTSSPSRYRLRTNKGGFTARLQFRPQRHVSLSIKVTATYLFCARLPTIWRCWLKTSNRGKSRQTARQIHYA